MNELNKNEAPAGFYATPKPSFTDVGQSICRVCDWRIQCCDPLTDFSLPQHKCMSYARRDRVGVIFKRVLNENN